MGSHRPEFSFSCVTLGKLYHFSGPVEQVSKTTNLVECPFYRAVIAERH